MRHSIASEAGDDEHRTRCRSWRLPPWPHPGSEDPQHPGALRYLLSLVAVVLRR